MQLAIFGAGVMMFVTGAALITRGAGASNMWKAALAVLGLFVIMGSFAY